MPMLMSLVEVFSVSIKLAEESCAGLSCTVDAAGNLVACGTGTSYSSSQEGQTSDSINPEHNDDFRVNLCGKIHVGAGLGALQYLYNRDPEKPECVGPKDTISLTGPSKSFLAMSLELVIELMDKDRGLHVSRGFITYNVNDPKAFFSTRLSAVVHGDIGCAIVHYKLFKNAMEAYIKVRLYTDDGDEARLNTDDGDEARLNTDDGDNTSSASHVFGSIVVAYGGHEYSNEYQRKYYRTALFRQGMHDAVQLNGNSIDLPLSRSVVVAPMDTSIIIDADLYEKSGETKIVFVKECAEFSFQKDCTVSKEIKGENGRMVLTLQWRYW